MCFHFVVLPAIFLRIISTGQRLFLGPLENLWHVRAAQPGAVVDALQGQHHPVLQLINPDIGVGGVEGNAASGLQMGTRHTPSGLKKQRLVYPAFDALVQNSVDMASAAKKHADASELSSLSATLRNLKDACADPEIPALSRTDCAWCWRWAVPRSWHQPFVFLAAAAKRVAAVGMGGRVAGTSRRRRTSAAEAVRELGGVSI